MIYYLSRKNDYDFFENQRFTLENVPTWEDLDFLLAEKSIQDINFKISDKKAKVPLNIWKILIKLLQYKQKGPIPNLRKEAISKNPDIAKYIESGDIKGFEDFEYKNGKTLLEATKDVNVESYSNMYELFCRGDHIGYCQPTSRLIGVMFENPQFHSGNLPCIAGTKNSEDGNHAWVETEINGKEYIVDTSTMLVIPKELKEKVGYIDGKKPYSKDYLINDYRTADKYYDHYEIRSKISTKDKFSYVTYRENIKKLEKIMSRRNER
ncbi:MAG: hypothetical protein IJ223_05660 [Clostridia bacterium]|nr:hypothetical protein [Clostridia bacterium]